MSNKSKINILFVLPNFDTGGSEKLVMDIIRNIDKTHFNPVLAVFYTGTYEEEYLKLGYPFYVLHRDGVRSKLQTLLFFKKIVRKHKIDIVNAHHAGALIQGYLAFKVFGRTRVIYTEHTRFIDDPNVHAKALFVAKILSKRIDAVVGISKSICEDFNKELGVPEDKIKLILNGVDIDRFKLSNFDRISYRAKLGFKENEILIGTFANFRPQKNHLSLIRAVAQLISEGVENFRLVLCGNGPMEDEVKSLVENLGLVDQVVFMGTRLDIPELMNILDLYCLPSHFEGLPFSVLEAMAAKCPVVATNVEGNNEVVKHQSTGILVDSDSPLQLANALVELMQNPEHGESLAENAYNYVKDLSFDNMMQNYEDLFQQVYEGHF